MVAELTFIFNNIHTFSPVPLGDHGYFLDIERFERQPLIYRFYRSHLSVLGAGIHFWFSDAAIPEFMIHRDLPGESALKSSLIFGLINCDGNSVTRFYSGGSEGIVDTASGIIVPSQKDSLVLEYEAIIETGKAYIFNNEFWHGMENSSKQTRVVASWWANFDCDFDTLQAHFS